MNFVLDDRHRSIRRLLMNALGSPPWRVRTERQPVRDDERPAGVVEVVGPIVPLFARRSVPQGDVRRQQTFTVTLYPEVDGTAAEARLRAETVAQQLADALGVGLSNDDGSVLSAPESVPVYDFAGVPVKGAARAGPQDAYGYMTADDYPVRAIQDPEDPLRWTVTCDLRVSWWQGGRLGPDAPLATELIPVPPGEVPPGGVDPTDPWPPPASPQPLGRGVIDP